MVLILIFAHDNRDDTVVLSQRAPTELLTFAGKDVEPEAPKRRKKAY